MANDAKKPETEIVNTVSNVIKLDINKCQLIRPLSGTKEYQNTKEGSRYAGKSFRTFLYAGKGFTVPEDDLFCIDIDKDNLFEVELESTDEGYNFISHRSISRAMNAHKATVTMKAFTVEYVQSKKEYNPEELA